MRYAIITTEGATTSPDGDDVENIQILAFIDAADSLSALLEFREFHSQAAENIGFKEYRCFPEN
ncbi:MAG: hypothetical protein PWR17_269 [Candidatus Methanomethylophilaceae archaeon]|nr:hypothetical protein [Candidatus Methanomethylophilaceae archaeon]